MTWVDRVPDFAIIVLAVFLLSCCCGYCSYLTAVPEHDDEAAQKMNSIQRAHHTVHKKVRRMSSSRWKPAVNKGAMSVRSSSKGGDIV
jgi:hypothetical protein